MSGEAKSTGFSEYEPQLDRWLRKICEEVKEKTVTDLQVLTNQLTSENKELRKRIEKIEIEIAEIKKTLFFLELLKSYEWSVRARALSTVN